MSFDETIIHGSAPALCGIKSACLFKAENFFRSAQKIGLAFFVFRLRQKSFGERLQKSKKPRLSFVQRLSR